MKFAATVKTIKLEAKAAVAVDKDPPLASILSSAGVDIATGNGPNKHVPDWCKDYLPELQRQANVDPDTLGFSRVPQCTMGMEKFLGVPAMLAFCLRTSRKFGGTAIREKVI